MHRLLFGSKFGSKNGAIQDFSAAQTYCACQHFQTPAARACRVRGGFFPAACLKIVVIAVLAITVITIITVIIIVVKIVVIAVIVITVITIITVIIMREIHRATVRIQCVGLRNLELRFHFGETTLFIGSESFLQW